VLWNDPDHGVWRHADAGYDIALDARANTGCEPAGDRSGTDKVRHGRWILPCKTRLSEDRRIVGAAGAALAAPAIAQDVRNWKLVTAWPKNLPGPGVAAQTLADRITTLSGGRINVTLYAAGEIVPGNGVFDAVSEGTASSITRCRPIGARSPRASCCSARSPSACAPMNSMAG
jgi:hypothetical protein